MIPRRRSVVIPKSKPFTFSRILLAPLKTARNEGVLEPGPDSSYDLDLSAGLSWLADPSAATTAATAVKSCCRPTPPAVSRSNDRIPYFIRPTMKSKLASAPRQLTVADSDGNAEYDRLFIFARPWNWIQRLNGWERSRLAAMKFFEADYRRINAVADELYNPAGFANLRDAKCVRNISPNIFDWLICGHHAERTSAS